MGIPCVLVIFKDNHSLVVTGVFEKEIYKDDSNVFLHCAAGQTLKACFKRKDAEHLCKRITEQLHASVISNKAQSLQAGIELSPV